MSMSAFQVTLVLIVFESIASLSATDITSSSDGGGGEVMSREQCIQSVVFSMVKLELDSELSAILDKALQERRTKLMGSEYIGKEPPRVCRELRASLLSIGAANPCFSNRKVMGPDPYADIAEVMMADEHAERVVDAEYLCSATQTESAVAQDEGFFEAIAKQLSPKPKGEENDDEDYEDEYKFGYGR